MSESLQDLLASLRQRARAPVAMPALPALARGDVIEIQGPAASGKTHLLYHVLLAVLSHADPQIAAVVYDTDGAFDMARFRRLLVSRTCPHDILARVHVFRPTSLPHLAASIANLPAYHASRMPNQEIALLAVDSISAFHWPDRFSAEQLRSFSPEKPLPHPLHHVFSAIQTVRRSHAPVVVLTNWVLHSAPSRSGSPYAQHLHPFPVLDDGIADLGHTASSRASSSPFRLAHHIALSFPSSDSSAAPLDAAETRHDGRPLCGLSRSSGTRDAVCFALQITDDDVFVDSR